MQGLIWIQTVRHSKRVSERIFEKVNFKKCQQTSRKIMKNYIACKELKKLITVSNLADADKTDFLYKINQFRPNKK